jgi:hypothetical protein
VTGYTVHTGASKKFVSGWDRVFGKETGSGTAKNTKKQDSAKKSGKKKKK